MKLNSIRTLAATALVGLTAVATCAHARDNVQWSVGVQAAPGVSIGVGNVRPVYVAPAPVYVAPAPVYVAPPPVVVAPAPVYYGYAPAPVYYSGGYYVRPGKRWHNKHHHNRHWN
jgi:hypothetical protein